MRLLVLVLLMALISACGPPPTPTPTPEGRLSVADQILESLGTTREQLAQVNPTPTATPPPTATATPTLIPTPTLTPTPSPVPTATPTPPTFQPEWLPEWFVASEAAWDCFFDVLALPSEQKGASTDCGWHYAARAFYHPNNPTYCRMTGGTPEQVAMLKSAMAEITQLSGIEFIEASDERDVLEIEFVAVGKTPCGTNPRIAGCAQHPTAWGREGMHGGRVWLTPESDANTMRHELMHAVFDFIHADGPADSILRHDEDLRTGTGFTEQDKEMLAMFRIIPHLAYGFEIEARACIGEDGVCERPYA